MSYKEKEQESRCLYMSDSQPLALCTMSHKLHCPTLNPEERVSFPPSLDASFGLHFSILFIKKL